jgi:hypothetical protein
MIRLTDSRSDGHHRLFWPIFRRKSADSWRAPAARRGAGNAESSAARLARGLLIAGLALRLAGAAGLAGAAPPPDPVLSARLLAPIPADAAIALEPLDDSDDNLRLRDQLADALAARTRRLAADGPLVLRFAGEITADIRRTGSGLRGPGPGRGAGRIVRDDFAAHHVGSGDPKPSTVWHVLRATLAQRDGAVLWRGEASRVLVGNDEPALWRQLGDALMGAFGQTLDTRLPAPGDAGP